MARFTAGGQLRRMLYSRGEFTVYSTSQRSRFATHIGRLARYRTGRKHLSSGLHFDRSLCSLPTRLVGGRGVSKPFAGYHVLILLIEDHAVLREATKLVLESHGYEVLAVGRAAEALDLLHNGARPSVILLDLIMPDMDGFQFRERQMKDSMLASIPVVVWSGLHIAPSDSQRLHGATVLPKPVNPNVMLQTIEALRQRRG